MTNSFKDNYAGFWLRFAAILLDGVILGIPTLVPVFLFYPFVPRLLRVLGLPIYLLLVPILYFALLESSRWQATPGKMAFGLMVTDMDGQRISFLRATGRTLARALSGWLTLNIGYVMAAFTQKKQGLHDLIAGTLVLKK